MEAQGRGLDPSLGARSRAVSRPLAVLHLLESAEPGGREQWVLDIVSRMDRSRFKVTVLFRLCSGLLKNEFERAGIKTIYWEGTSDRGLSNLLRWVRLLRRDTFDIIHTHPGPYRFRMLARWVSQARVVTHVHGLPEESDETQDIKFCRRVLRGGDVCLVSTRWLAGKLQGDSSGAPAKIEVLYGGLDADRFQGIDERSVLRTAWGFPLPILVIGTVARLVPNKGVDTLLRALAALSKKFTSVGLVIVGDGPLRNELETLSTDLGLSNRVRFLGWRRDLPQILSAVDLFALASHREGFPLAPLEAMVSGKPSLVSDLPVYREILPPSLWSFLTPPGLIDAWVNQLSTLAQNVELRQKLASQQHEAAVQFTLSRSLSRLEEIYSSLVG